MDRRRQLLGRVRVGSNRKPWSLGLGQLVLFFVSGLALGAIENRHPWLLGLTAVSLLPVAALLEVRADPSSHTLLPLAILFYGAYGLLIGAGVSTSRQLAKRN